MVVWLEIPLDTTGIDNSHLHLGYVERRLMYDSLRLGRLSQP
jgi:hypothetical protein